MNDELLRLVEKLDLVELPLKIFKADIDEIGRIVDGLRAGKATSARPPDSGPKEPLALAESIYRFRRNRDEAFGRDMFSDPRWDMLLDLFIAAERKKRISVSSVCIAAACPATTALRHLSAMVREGLVQRMSDGNDRRMVWVELSTETYAKLADVLGSWR